jgi:peroxiredoxin
MAFINGLDRRWSGALPASFLYDGKGRLFHFWESRVNEAGLEEAMNALLVTLTATALTLGAKAPLADLKMKSAADKKDVTIASAAGAKGTLVVFTCNHCPFAKAWEERIVKIGNDAQAKGLGVILINSNDPTDHGDDDELHTAEHHNALGMKFPYAIDATSEIAKAFGATKTPEAYLFDKDGKLVYHGTIDDNHKEPAKVQKRYLQDAVDAVLAGKTPATQETKGLGCSIKMRS